jgi:XTP/dITP diphosphohydrolase
MKRLLLASSNPHKLDEVRAVFAPLGIEIDGLDSLVDQFPEPEETGDTFEENARIKAVEYAAASGRTCLADDSGLEVDALKGAPGVHSARFAGTGADRRERDEANNRKLVSMLEGVAPEERAARFVCAMCLADPGGGILAESRGTFDGVVVDQARGSNGFGYDPHLYLPDRDCTSAELSPDEKNARSHRGEAARAIAASITSLPDE